MSSQLNRFHEATVDHDSRDILLQGVDVAIEGKDLLIDSQIKIEAGYHYGLVGRNGIGKSTFLRVTKKTKNLIFLMVYTILLIAGIGIKHVRGYIIIA